MAPHTHYEMPYTSADGLRYLVQWPLEPLPESGWPLLLYVHGYGNSPFDEGAPPARVRRGDPSLSACAVVAPFVPPDHFCLREELHNVVQAVITRGGIDKQRVYGAGWSMGANGVTGLALKHPELFAAVIAVASPGGLTNAARAPGFSGMCCVPPQMMPSWLFRCLGMRYTCCFMVFGGIGIATGCFRFIPAPDSIRREEVAGATRVPILFLHGEADRLVPPSYSQMMYDALREDGSTVARYIIHPGLDHNSLPRKAFADADTYAWLFKHVRGSGRAPPTAATVAVVAMVVVVTAMVAVAAVVVVDKAR